MAYFECIVGNGGGGTSGIPLIVNCNANFAGTTISVSDGTTTLTAQCPSSSPYTVEFELPNDGTWTASGVYSGQTFYSDPVTVTPYEVNLETIPEGATVTPTDDIQIWLHCANIWDKAYTTIAQVLNDSTTVTALIASNNAADYMARSTTWASSVCANSSAMTKIGANNYCADALLRNSTWATAIANSTYYESVLTSKVPTMTSNTTPSGKASASSEFNSSYQAWKAFDGTNSSGSDSWASDNSDTDMWLEYEFTSSILLRKVVATTRNDSAAPKPPATYVIEGYINNAWVALTGTLTNTVNTANTIFCNQVITNNNKASRFRLRTLTKTSSENLIIGKLQFYGRT